VEACPDEPPVPITACSAWADPDEIARKPITIIGDDPRVDVLTVASQVTFDQACPRRIVRRIKGVRVPYLGRRDLVRSKQTGRLQDLADLERLGLEQKP
jgi:hypothetical protein